MLTDYGPTKRTQKILITLIVIVAVLLIISLLAGIETQPTPDADINRADCLQRGGVWDNTKQQCYDNSALRQTARSVRAV